MTCECYQDEHGNWFNCPDCEHDKWLEVQEERRLEKMIEDDLNDNQ